MAVTVDPQTLDFIFSQSKDVPETQMRTAEALDSKTVQVFAAATVVIGLAATGGIHGHAPIGPLVVAACVYLAVVGSTLASLRSRQFRTNASPAILWHDHWQDEPEALKLALVEDLASGYAENDALLRDKARTFKATLALTGVEAALVATALVASLV